jgi:nucleoside-diphosphate-sugar epimerase
MLELAQAVASELGAKDRIEHRPLPADDPTQRQPDITLAKSELGWSPKVPLREGLRRTIAWFQALDMAKYQPPSPFFEQPEAQRK